MPKAKSTRSKSKRQTLDDFLDSKRSKKADDFFISRSPSYCPTSPVYSTTLEGFARERKNVCDAYICLWDFAVSPFEFLNLFRSSGKATHVVRFRSQHKRVPALNFYFAKAEEADACWDIMRVYHPRDIFYHEKLETGQMLCGYHADSLFVERLAWASSDKVSKCNVVKKEFFASALFHEMMTHQVWQRTFEQFTISKLRSAQNFVLPLCVSVEETIAVDNKPLGNGLFFDITIEKL